MTAPLTWGDTVNTVALVVLVFRLTVGPPHW
jgi:hypothetical protein